MLVPPVGQCPVISRTRSTITYFLRFILNLAVCTLCRYNFESPVFAGRRGVVYKRAVILHDAHKRHHHHHYRPDLPVNEDPNSPNYTPPGKRNAGGAGEGETEVPAQDVQNDLEYVVAVKVGTPGVTLQLDFDTGSSDLWVWSSEYTGTKTGHVCHSP